MRFFQYFKKLSSHWVKLLTVFLPVLLGSWVFYITGCHNVDMFLTPSVDCSELEGLAGCLDDEVITGEIFDAEYFDAPPPGAVIPENIEPADRPLNPDDFKKVKDVPLNLLDIIFVVDTSPSMREELAGIASQFDAFLRRIRELNYHIAIITADAAKDRGEFLFFPNGKRFLSNAGGDSHKQNVRDFRQLIQRVVGASSDERGIYALNMALDNAQHRSFFRKHSALRAIIISDEDERTYGGVTPSDVDIGTAPPLENYDYPVTFFQKIYQYNNMYGVTVDSIIVKPGDSDCQARSGGVPGSVYAEASHPSDGVLSKYGHVRRGVIGSICENDYGVQLGPIADSVMRARPIQLDCTPDPARIRVRVDGGKVDYRLNGHVVQIEDSVSLGAAAKVVYRCLR